VGNNSSTAPSRAGHLRVYRWGLKMRTRVMYGRIAVIEKDLQSEILIQRIVDLQKELEIIDKQSSRMSFPRRHLDLLFSLKVHINLVRGRLAVRLAELKSALPN